MGSDRDLPESSEPFCRAGPAVFSKGLIGQEMGCRLARLLQSADLGKRGLTINASISELGRRSHPRAHALYKTYVISHQFSICDTPPPPSLPRLSSHPSPLRPLCIPGHLPHSVSLPAMPAERLRPSKRCTAQGERTHAHADRRRTGVTDTDLVPDARLTLDVSVKIESMSQSIAFAPNVTPGTYHDPPSPADTSAESLLFPTCDDGGAAARRAAHAKKRPENHIPRPPNAFILFRSSFIKQQHVSSEVETNHSTLSKIIGLTWQNLPHEERQFWHAKAKAALEEHKRKFPQYAFRPLHTKGRAPTEKRKVREVEPKDLKRCAKIAELLVEGKKGRELDHAIQEFDRHHVPEIVTRFEAPITARHYRRSSSAPAPDTERSNGAFLSPEPSTPSKRKPKRSSSSQPDAPREASHDCATPSPSPSDVDTESDWYSSPSSPYNPTTPSYPLPPTNPSFVSVGCLSARWRFADEPAG